MSSVTKVLFGQDERRQVKALAVASAVVLGALIALLGEIGLFASLALPLILAELLIFIHSPVWLLCVLPVVAAGVTMFREVAISLGGTQMTLSGLLWLSIAGLVSLYLLANVKKVSVPGYLWPFLLFLLWAALRWLITPSGFLGLKDILWYSLPVVFGLFVPLALNTGHGSMVTNVRRIEKAFLYSALIPPTLYAIALSTGLAEMTWRGPRGELVGAARGTPLYLLIVLSLALANWRYGPMKRGGGMISFLVLGTIFFTLARMAGMLGILLTFLYKIDPRKKWQILGGVLFAGMLAFYVITHVPVLKERFFFTEEWDLSMGFAGVNTAGRNVMWPAVLQSTLREPIVGHGLGQARLVTARLFAGKKDVTEYHPHNEYLQVFHDLGVIGLLLLLLAWWGVFWRAWRVWSWNGPTRLRKWAMASALGVGAVLVSALTDNSLHYPMVVVPTFVIVAIGDALHSGGAKDAPREDKGPLYSRKRTVWEHRA